MILAEHSPDSWTTRNQLRRARANNSARRWRGLLLFLSLAIIGCKRGAAPQEPAGLVTRPVASDQPIRFEEMTDPSGVRFHFTSGREANHNSILEWLGGGVAICDFDLDGHSDLVFAGGGTFQEKRIVGGKCALFRNVDLWRYEDVSDMAFGEQSPYYNHGCHTADFDNDGFVDLLITGYGGLKLYHNKGDGTFLEVQRESALDDNSWSTSAGWGDFNGDGNLDLYVAHYVNWSFENHPVCRVGDKVDVCPPKQFEALPDTLFMSCGDGSFRNATREAGLRDDGKGLGVIVADLDQDNDVDIYVANDTTDNFLYLNDGHGNLEEVGLLSGVSGDDVGDPNGSMGVDVGDFNQDGLLDLWVANFAQEPFALYRNYGRGQFQHVSKSTGINAFHGLFVGFGTAFVDLDLDGDEDLVVANGHVVKYPANAASVRQLPLMLLNRDSQRYERLEFVAGNNYFATQHLGRGLAADDLDDDGDIDLVISHLDEPVALLRNDTSTNSSWLRVRLIGRVSNRDAIGAIVTLHTSRGDQLRAISGGGSYLSQRDQRLSWGIDDGTKVHKLSVVWPSGIEQHVTPMGLNMTITLHEPGRAGDDS